MLRDNLIVSREIQEKLLEYVAILTKWNSGINLISSGDLEKIWERHIIDSIQLLKYIDNVNIEVLDIGSGAGFPGIVLSLSGIKKVTLVESDQRKVVFLNQVKKISPNEISIINDRVENLKDINCDILTSRAFSSLDKLFSMCCNFNIKDKMLLHKGSSFEEELDQAKKHWLFDLKIHDSITSGMGKILEIYNLRVIKT